MYIYIYIYIYIYTNKTTKLKAISYNCFGYDYKQHIFIRPDEDMLFIIISETIVTYSFIRLPLLLLIIVIEHSLKYKNNWKLFYIYIHNLNARRHYVCQGMYTLVLITNYHTVDICQLSSKNCVIYFYDLLLFRM